MEKGKGERGKGGTAGRGSEIIIKRRVVTSSY